MRELVAERERNGPFASLGELAGRIGARRRTLEQLAWSGACDEITTGSAGGSHGREADRRTALWQLGIAAPGTARGEGTQLALPLELPAAPRLRSLGRWQRLIADYATSGVTVGDHAMAILRERLTVPMLATSAQLARLPSGGAVAMAGLVIARQRPGDGQGDDVPAVRGRVRDGQPDRAARRCTSAIASSRAPSRCCWRAAASSARKGSST